MPGLPVHHQLPEIAQTHVHRVSDAIQPSHPLSSPSPPAFNLFQNQGLSQWVSSSHQVTEVLEYYSTLKRNEVVTFVEMWMDLESVIQSEVSPLVLDQGIFHGIYNHLAPRDGKGHFKESILNLNSSHITGGAEHKRRWKGVNNGRPGNPSLICRSSLISASFHCTDDRKLQLTFILQHSLFYRRCASFLYKC